MLPIAVDEEAEQVHPMTVVAAQLGVHQDFGHLFSVVAGHIEL